MIIVKLDNKEENWGIIELQGELKSRAGGLIHSQFVGDLHYSIQENGVPVLIIGHHILYGKCVQMEKPFAVMEKVGDEEKTEYIVKGIVKQKLVFKIRPKPIIASSDI